MLKKILLFVIALVAAASTHVAAEGLILPGDEGFTDRDHFSDNLWGLHTNLQEKYGLSFEFIYRQDFIWNTHGGESTNSTPHMPRMAGMYFELETAKAGLWENGTFFLGLEYITGSNPSTESRVGDWQWLSWISTDRRHSQISEAWYRHTFLEEKLWFKFGKMEANYEFNAIDYSFNFLNSSAMLNPTIPIPTYPDQDWGLAVGIVPADWFSCNFGIYQGKINGSRSVGNTLDDLRGPMLIMEPSFQYELAGLPGKVNIGAWWNGRTFDAYHENRTNRTEYGSSYGFYGFIQQLLWKENTDSDCEQGIGAYAEYGWTPGARFEVDNFVGAGLNWQGAIPTRDDDALGLGAFTVFFSDTAGFDESSETAVELFYKAYVTSWLVLQPDVQYITNPGGTNNSNAVVVGGRVEFIF